MEHYIGGSIRQPKAGELFYTLSRKDELIPFLKALLEEYRKNAYFQESIGEWIQKTAAFPSEKNCSMRK